MIFQVKTGIFGRYFEIWTCVRHSIQMQTFGYISILFDVKELYFEFGVQDMHFEFDVEDFYFKPDANDVSSKNCGPRCATVNKLRLCGSLYCGQGPKKYHTAFEYCRPDFPC